MLETQPASHILPLFTSYIPQLSMMQVLYRLTCVWFLICAVICCVFSIPLSLVGLPLVLISGMVVTLAATVISLVINAWVRFLRSCWSALKGLAYSPLSILQYAVGQLTTKADQSKKKRLSISSNHSKSSSADYADRYFSTDHDRNNLEMKPPVDNAKWNYVETNSMASSPFVQNSSPYMETIEPSLDRPSLVNPHFLFLDPGDVQRLEVCKSLFSEITNTPIDQCTLPLGQVDGSTHSILSVWNDHPISYTNLIGFVHVLF